MNEAQTGHAGRVGRLSQPGRPPATRGRGYTGPSPAIVRPAMADPLSRLVDALHDPACYPHPVGDVTHLETHISHVLLAGDFAYKLKKPVDFGFLDFRRLADRRRFCEEEIRLNRRTAPRLYLDVVPITGTPDDPQVGGPGPALEYAVRMRRFDQACLLDRLARDGALDRTHAAALGRTVAEFHAGAARAAAGDVHCAPGAVIAPALQNFDQLDALADTVATRARLAALRAWTDQAFATLRPAIAARGRDGFVRECHGDLHLGNIAWLDGAPVPFDAIEFDPALRWIDTISDFAFLWMDLLDHRLPALAAVCLDAWLEAGGDHAGLALLRFHAVYRAMVRAKIAALRAAQGGSGAAAAAAAHDGYLDLAERLTRPPRPALLVMHGLSGSGKSALALTLTERLGAVRVRSDVERKRLHGPAPAGPSASTVDAGLYTPAASETTYARLATLARDLLAAQWTTIIDATCLRRADRARFRALATACGVACILVTCNAPEEELRRRIVARARIGADPSDADTAVLAGQMRAAEALDDAERGIAIEIDTTDPAATRQAVDLVVARLSG